MTGKPKKQCVIHGHFYQPPRENPWINIIEKQPSAAPYHDWNERIFDECYRPNAYSRILNSDRMIESIINNYQYMSFNFGPTLFKWIEKYHPITALRIIEADKKSVEKFNGHGNAIAQVYNHIIMPHASYRDKLTQIRWAKSFFRRKFGRESEGIWLAETAINNETVEALIAEKIKFVILSPTQAEAYCSISYSDSEWKNVADGSIYTKRAYRLFEYENDGVRKDKFIDVFFFDEGLSRAVSFEQLLSGAEKFTAKVNGAFSETIDDTELVTIATDGETFGHHFAFGDMCLAYFFKNSAKEAGIELTNFGYFLEQNPPVFEVKLKNGEGEGSAWSCAHGTGRWIRDCGCQTGGDPSWNQKWRGPLRTAFNNLQEKVDNIFVEELTALGVDPWKIRDNYEALIDSDNFNEFRTFVSEKFNITNPDNDLVFRMKALLESQKFMLFSYTSCGWFFSDVSGIETVQDILFAARTLQLAFSGDKQRDIKKEFASDLEKAVSNIRGINGKTLYEKYALSNTNHTAVLAFTAVVENVRFRSDISKFNYFGFTIKLSEIDENIFSVAVENPKTGESDDFRVYPEFASQSFITAKVVASDNSYITIDTNSIFYESKVRFTSLLLKKILSDSDSLFTKWIKSEKDSLNFIMNLNDKIPSELSSLLKFTLTERWNRIVDTLLPNRDDNIIKELGLIYDEAKFFGVDLDWKHTSDIILKSLREEMQIVEEKINAMAFSPDDKCCDNIRYYLNIIDRFALPVPKSTIEDKFYRIFSGGFRDIYNRYISGDSDLKAIVIKMISFARRMNFSTDNYRVEK